MKRSSHSPTPHLSQEVLDVNVACIDAGMLLNMSVCIQSIFSLYVSLYSVYIQCEGFAKLTLPMVACLDAATISDITVAFFNGSMIDDHFQAPTPNLREPLAAAAADTEAGTVPYTQDGVEGGVEGGVDDPTTTSAPGKAGAGGSVEDGTGGGSQGNDDEAGGAGAGEPGLAATNAAATMEGADDEAAAGEGGAGSSVVGEVDSAGAVGEAGDTGGEMGENGG